MSQTPLDVLVDDDGTIHIGPRTIPPPSSISDAARQLFIRPRMTARGFPPLDDKDGWRRHIEEMNVTMRPIADLLLRRTEGRVTVETTTVAGVTVHIATPTRVPTANGNRVWIAVHGGALIYGARLIAHAEAAEKAAAWDCVVYSVDYRVAPDHPYPAAVDDVVTVYRSLLERYEPRDIVVSGVSAGGNIASSALLSARDAGLPLPGALILNTPECDLTESGDSFQVLRDIDCVLVNSLSASIALYADGHDLSTPYLSPLFGDFHAGFPPTYIQSGTRDLFLSNCVRLHRALRTAGIDAELHVWEGAPHGGFAFVPDAPENAEMHAEQAHFLAKHWGVA